MLDAIGCRLHLRTLERPFYVYVLHRPDGAPFYVGKGVGERVLHHVSEARNHPCRLTHKLNVIRAIERDGGVIRYVIHGCFSEESEAHAAEMRLIAEIGRFDLRRGPLTNQTDGGEGGSNPSQESRERRASSLSGDDAADEQRAVANRFFSGLLAVGSVPIKQSGSLKLEALSAHPSPRRPTPRQAGALAASAIANRVLLGEGVAIPRRMEIDGHTYFVENGVGRDILKSGLAHLVAAPRPTDESFLLTALGLCEIGRHVERSLLVAAGVLTPDSGSQ